MPRIPRQGLTTLAVLGGVVLVVVRVLTLQTRIAVSRLTPPAGPLI